VTRMAHLIDHLPTLGDSEGPVAGSPRVSRGSWIRIAIASLATVLGLSAWQLGYFTAGSEQASMPDPVPPPVAAAPAKPTSPVAPSPTSTAAPIDRGFTNPAARCDAPLQMVVAGRTASSLVVVCREPGGRLVYKGVRLSLGAGTQIDGVTATAGTFVARNETATYTLTPKELVIAMPGAPVAREPILEYRTPRATPPARVPRSVPPAPAAPRSAPPAPVAATKKPAPSAAAAKRPPVAAITTPFEKAGTGAGQVSFTADDPWRLRYSMTCPAGKPISGYISADSSTGNIYYGALRGGAADPSVAGGSSLVKSTSGTVAIDVIPGGEGCAWTVSVN